MWWLCWAATALAGNSAVELRTALAAGDVRSARSAVGELDTALGGSRSEVLSVQLAFRYQAQGAISDLQSRQREMHEAFRNAWIVAPNGRPDRDVLTRPDLVDAYGAVQSEVFRSEVVDLRWMKLPENAPVRVDGVPVGTQPVFRGRHHVQVQCADGSWSSQWTVFNRAEDWAHACPDGALAPLTAEGARSSEATVLEIELSGRPDTAPSESDAAEPVDASTDAPADEPDDRRTLPPDASWYERSIAWVRDFELPRSPKGRLLLGGPVVGLGTGAELQFVPGGDSGGFFTTVAATHMPLHASADGVDLLRLTAAELGVGYQPANAGAVGFEVRGGSAVYHDTVRYTDGFLYLTGAAGARWDAPGTGRVLFVGLAYTGNLARGFVAPRASLGWQF
ncbi:MAG TPA: hypothetical protein DFR83_00275 [Deltaproteobacteria bacterium]|nr:hypothetical protein [Deltaproteobacteria bacterium]